MSAKGSCPDTRPQVGDRQVETLTSYTLRAGLGTAQPRPDAWLRLRGRILAAGSAAAPAEPTFNDRFWRSLLVVGPRLSSMGVALAMLALFVHSSLVPLAPPASDAGQTPASNVPVIKLDYLTNAGVTSVAAVPVMSPDAVRQSHLAQEAAPPLYTDADPTPHKVSVSAFVEEADPVVRSRYVAAPAPQMDIPQISSVSRN